jgi:hypothetical protein
MNGVAYGGEVLKTPEGINAAVQGLNKISGGWERLYKWRDKEIQRKLRSIWGIRRKSRSIWLIDYIIEVANRVPRPTGQREEIAEDAFKRYLGSLGVSQELAEYAIERAELREEVL